MPLPVGIAEKDERILAALQEKPRACFELARISVQYNANIFRLRRKGYKIKCVRDPKNSDHTVFEYQGRMNEAEWAEAQKKWARETRGRGPAKGGESS